MRFNVLDKCKYLNFNKAGYKIKSRWDMPKRPSIKFERHLGPQPFWVEKV